MRRLSLLAPALVALVLPACGESGATGTSERERIVAAFYPLAWATEQVGGASVDVDNLTPAGAEPHDLELTPRDVDRIRDADLVVYLGGGFQPALEKALGGREGPSLDLLRGQNLAAAPEGEEELAIDPHVWLDPVRFEGMVRAIGRELGRPRAAARVVARLEALGADYRRGLASCRRHDLVTSHAAFGYLAKRYGLHQVALAGLSPEAEPSPRDLEGLVREVERSGASTVFFETLVSPRLAETVAREAGVKTAVLDPIEGLTKDEIAGGADYLSVMRTDLAALRRALACR
jgi:zinc transport system substrate-binding protein